MPIIDTAQYASATKLKTHTREVIENTHKFGEVFVMHNNTPTAIILSVEKYNDFIENYSPIIGELVEPDAFEKLP